MSDSFGYGQIIPDDGASDLNTTVAIVRQMMATMNMMKLVQVTAFNPGTGSPPTNGTVNVQLLVSQVDGQAFATPHGIVNNLPVWRFQGGKWAIIADPAKDDYGYIICADRDSSLVVKKPGMANPGSARKYNVADGLYIGGCLNAVPAATVWLKSDGTLKISDANSNVVDTTSGSWVFTGPVEFKDTVKIDALETGEDGLNVTGAITATGEVTALFGTANSVGLSTHLTPTAPAGPVSPPTPGT